MKEKIFNRNYNERVMHSPVDEKQRHHCLQRDLALSNSFKFQLKQQTFKLCGSPAHSTLHCKEYLAFCKNKINKQIIQSRKMKNQFIISLVGLTVFLPCCWTSGQVILQIQIFRLTQVMLIVLEASEPPQKCQSHRSPQSTKGFPAGFTLIYVCIIPDNTI